VLQYVGTAALTSAEVYDPSARARALVACVPKAVAAHTATTLTDGKLLVAGGRNSSSSSSVLAVAWLFQE
jgi:hypothetical protein